MQIAAAYFASTCRRINDCALRRLRPHGAFNTAVSFVLRCFSALMEFGARGAPEGPANPRGAAALGRDAPTSGHALGGSEGIVAQDQLVSKESFVNRVEFTLSMTRKG